MEHILLQSGFKRESKSNKYIIDLCEGYYFMFTGKIGIFCKTDRGSLGCPIRYMHHFQNTYYAITGKEIRFILPDEGKLYIQ